MWTFLYFDILITFANRIVSYLFQNNRELALFRLNVLLYQYKVSYVHVKALTFSEINVAYCSFYNGQTRDGGKNPLASGLVRFAPTANLVVRSSGKTLHPQFLVISSSAIYPAK